MAEKKGNFDLAVGFYRQALSLEPVNSDTWYFILNNLGFSLNQLKQFAEGEVCCRRAIAIKPLRANAHKNLGLALQGQRYYRDAAEAFVAAIKANASDRRALGHLENLLKAQPELETEFTERLDRCRKAVAHALRENDGAWVAHLYDSTE